MLQQLSVAMKKVFSNHSRSELTPIDGTLIQLILTTIHESTGVSKNLLTKWKFRNVNEGIKRHIETENAKYNSTIGKDSMKIW